MGALGSTWEHLGALGSTLGAVGSSWEHLGSTRLFCSQPKCSKLPRSLFSLKKIRLFAEEKVCSCSFVWRVSSEDVNQTKKKASKSQPKTRRHTNPVRLSTPSSGVRHVDKNAVFTQTGLNLGQPPLFVQRKKFVHRDKRVLPSAGQSDA